MRIYVVSVLSMVVFLQAICGTRGDTLKSVQLVFRHGAKIDDSGYEKRDGLLKNLGKAQMYELGKLIRERYPNLLKSEYDPEEIEILSSDVNRCVQSGALFAYGLYDESNRHANWSETRRIPYQPVPVYTLPREHDRYLQLTENCPRREEIKQEVDRRNDHIFVMENQDFIQAYINVTGDLSVLDETISIPERMTKLYFESGAGGSVEIPEWARPYKSRFQESTRNVNRELRKSLDYRRLQVGPLLEMLLSRMNTSDGPHAKKLYAYSGHEYTMTALGIGLLLDSGIVPAIPSPASVFILETHQVSDETDSYLEVYFRDKPSQPLTQLLIPDCIPVCFISSLRKWVNQILPENYVYECNVLSNTNLN